MSIDTAAVRERFPALERELDGIPVAYFDGPGGTQVPRDVVEVMTDYLYRHNANTRWMYPSSRETDAIISGAREALADKIRPGQEGASAQPKLNPTIDKVQDVVARRWGVTPEGLRSKARIKTLTVPRQIAMYLAREVLQMQLVEIGQAFGGRDHSTVIHSVDKVQRQLQRDRQFRERVESARQELYAP